jgi:spermidine/putrescine transport system substrate-binding protein
MVLFWIFVLALFFGFSRIINFFSTERSINIFSWPTLLDVSYLERFEQETGIAIHVSYYESNEELFSKLRASKGSGYDLVIPSDYVVELMIREGLLQKIDRTRINAWQELDPKLLNLYFDPLNDYTIPYFWAAYGLGMDTTYFKGTLPEASWALIFDKHKIPGPIGMIDAAREAVLLAALYLYGNGDFDMTYEHITKIKKLLIEQKRFVASYTESNVEHLLLGRLCPLVVAMGPDILRVQRVNPAIKFVIPKEGSFVVVDSFAIPACSKKADLVYEFINFLLRHDVLEHHHAKFGMCCPVRGIQSLNDRSICPNDEEFAKMKFFKTTIPEALLNEIWVQLMAY